MVFVEGDDYRALRRPGDDPAGFRSVVRPGQLFDSLIHEYRAQNFTSSTWADTEQSADITVQGLASSTLNGEPSVSGDGVDDIGLGPTLAPFGANADTDFAIEFVLQTTDRARVIGVDNSGNGMALDIATDNGFDGASGTFTFALRSSNGSGRFLSVDSSVRVDDGTARHFIVNKTGNTASDVQIIVNAQDKTGTINRDNFDPTAAINFNEEIGYFGINNAGTLAAFLDGDIPFVRWYNDSLTPTQQQNLFDRQPYV
jgi:hypothetical protein